MVGLLHVIAIFITLSKFMKTDIHSFVANITDNIEIPNFPKDASITIYGYSYWGNPSADDRKHGYWIGNKLFVYEMDLAGCGHLSDDDYDNIKDIIEDYICSSFSVGMREHQISINSKYKKIKGVDFDFEELEHNRIDVEELNEIYKNKKWFNPKTYIIQSELSYPEYRMYHIITNKEKYLEHFLN